MKKVLLVSDFFYPHWTGISKSVDYLTQALKDNFQFTVLTIRYDQKLKHRQSRDGVKINRFDPHFKLSRTYISLLLLFKSFCHVKEADSVLINSPCSYVLFISLFAKLWRKKLFILHQGDLILPKGIINRFVQLLFDLMTDLSFSLADGIFSYTTDYIDHSRLLPAHKHKAKGLLIPLPYFIQRELEKRNSKTDVSLMLKALRRKHDYLIGFAGRFVEEKGFDILFEVVKRSQLKKAGVHLVFAGETQVTYEKTFQHYADVFNDFSDSITMMGLLDDNQLACFYSNLDIFILPSRSECFGLVQAEAMRYGCPVLVSDIPGARDVVKKTGYGETFVSENSSDLEKTLMCMIEHLGQDKNYYQNRYDKVESYFNYESAKNSLTAFLEG